jgi:hypothetical protein
MAFDLSGTHPANGTTHAVVGQTCNAYLASRFGNPLAAPAPNTAPPGSADAGPVTSIATASAVGQFTFPAVASAFVPYMVSYSDPNDGAANLYWLGPLLPMAATTTQNYAASVNQTANRTLGWTTWDVTMQGLTLPQATLTVASTALLTSSGYVLVGLNSAGPTDYELVQYTGKTATTLTGCTGGTGTIAYVNGPILQAYINGSLRRECRYSIKCIVTANPDAAYVSAVCDSGGVRGLTDIVGVFSWKQAVEYDGIYQVVFSVDPLGAYGIYPFVGSGGTLSIVRCIEVDG